MSHSFLLLIALTVSGAETEDFGVISGIAVNGTQSEMPLSGAEVILRAGRDEGFQPIGKVTTDTDGRFSFTRLPTDRDVIYLPGVNCGQVHYPGARIRLDSRRAQAQVKLVGYDEIESPSPLISREHVLEVRAETGFVEIAEKLLLENPTRTAYVGQKQSDHPPITLRLTLPPGFETVTFEKEFFGRQFRIHNGELVTAIPWLPGKHELKFSYRLPIEQRTKLLLRQLNQPSEHVTVRVISNSMGGASCSLPRLVPTHPDEMAFEHRGEALQAGHVIELRLGALPVGFDFYARWIAIAILATLVIGTLTSARWRNARRTNPMQRSGQSHRDRVTALQK